MHYISWSLQLISWSKLASTFDIEISAWSWSHTHVPAASCHLLIYAYIQPRKGLQSSQKNFYLWQIFRVGCKVLPKIHLLLFLILKLKKKLVIFFCIIKARKWVFVFFSFLNDDVNHDGQANALTLDDDDNDSLWHLSERRCGWCYRIFAEPRNLRWCWQVLMMMMMLIMMVMTMTVFVPVAVHSPQCDE